MNARQLILFLEIALIPNLVTGQSTFVFRNKYGGVNAPIFDAMGTPLAGPQYYAELYGGVASNSLAPATTVDSSAVRVIVPFLSGVNAGYILSSQVAVAWNAPPGGFAWLQLRAWDASLGATFEDVMALGLGGYGESELFYAPGGDPTLLPAGTPLPLTGLQSFSLRPAVPEPSAAAVLGLGVASLWWTARKRWL